MKEYPQFNTFIKRRKQYKYLYRKMLDKNIILKAYQNLRKGKTKRAEIKYIDAHLEEEANKLQQMIYYTQERFENTPEYDLGFFSYTTKPTFIYEHQKIRKIYMPEIHEQWIHHIIVIILKPIIYNPSYPYSCGSMPGRGAHYAKKYLEKRIRDHRYNWCLKMDIRHFYNNINKKEMFNTLKYVISDPMFLYFIKRCLANFHKGLPLGFYISQWLANFYLAELDRYIILMKCRAYVRYMDDMVIYHKSKRHLQNMKVRIAKYLCKFKKLKIKDNYQVFRVTAIRSIDFMGFKFYTNRVIIRKNIMIGATRLVNKILKKKTRCRKQLPSYYRGLLSYLGWFKYSNTFDCYCKYIFSKVSIYDIKHFVSKCDKIERRIAV